MPVGSPQTSPRQSPRSTRGGQGTYYRALTWPEVSLQILQVGGGSLALLLTLLTLVTLMDSIIGTRTDSKFEAMSLRHEMHINIKIDGIKMQLEHSFDEIKGQLKQLASLVNKRRRALPGE